MKNRLVLFILLIVLLTGCSLGLENRKENNSLEQQEGIIASIRENQDGWNQILVIPNVDEADISNKTEEELIQIAQENNGAYYGFKSDRYDNLKVGTEVIVYWDGSQLDSDPPQRGIEKVDVLSK